MAKKKGMSLEEAVEARRLKQLELDELEARIGEMEAAREEARRRAEEEAAIAFGRCLVRHLGGDWAAVDIEALDEGLGKASAALAGRYARHPGRSPEEAIDAVREHERLRAVAAKPPRPAGKAGRRKAKPAAGGPEDAPRPTGPDHSQAAPQGPAAPGTPSPRPPETCGATPQPMRGQA